MTDSLANSVSNVLRLLKWPIQIFFTRLMDELWTVGQWIKKRVLYRKVCSGLDWIVVKFACFVCCAGDNGTNSFGPAPTEPKKPTVKIPPYIHL